MEELSNALAAKAVKQPGFYHLVKFHMIKLLGI